MLKHLTVLLAFLMTLSSPLAAQDLKKGYAAYSAGDYATALQEWKPLAEAGDTLAQFMLGVLYLNGFGVVQDYKETVRLWTVAAKQGSVTAQMNLGLRYENGQGVLQDNAMAHMWYNIGSANGFEQSRTNRDRIAKIMTNADISKAQAMARECMSSNYKNCGH